MYIYSETTVYINSYGLSFTVVEELEHTLLTDENNKLEKSSLIRPRTFSSSSLKNPKLHTEVSVVSSASDSEQKKVRFILYSTNSSD